jgi:hypothetical protein
MTKSPPMTATIATMTPSVTTPLMMETLRRVGSRRPGPASMSRAALPPCYPAGEEKGLSTFPKNVE